MIFGEVPVAQALGTVLAHGTRLPGLMLHKGHVLGAPDVAALADAGFSTVAVARLEAGDVAEDEAADALAAALATPGLEVRRPGAGRANLIAVSGGLLRVAPARVDAINALDEGLTLATLPDDALVEAGTMVATVKIIPFAVRRSAVAAALEATSDAPAIRVAPLRPMAAGLVLTTLPGLKPSVVQGTISVTAARIAALGGSLLPPLVTRHDSMEVAAALRTLLDQGAEMLLVAGASAVVDRADVAPSAIVAAGGRILHFGMPVDPGNLLCLGEIGAVPALVLPGCARSPKPNGIDLMLARLAAGEAAGPAEIMRMGVGGLLQEYKARPAPRQGPRR